MAGPNLFFFFFIFWILGIYGRLGRSRHMKLMKKVGMENLFLRLSSSFACTPVKLDGKRKKETVFAHIVGGVHFEGLRIVFLLKYKQKTKKDEPQKTKNGLRLSSSLGVRLSSFFAYTSIKNQFSALQNGPLPQRQRRIFPSSSL